MPDRAQHGDPEEFAPKSRRWSAPENRAKECTTLRLGGRCTRWRQAPAINSLRTRSDARQLDRLAHHFTHSTRQAAGNHTTDFGLATLTTSDVGVVDQRMRSARPATGCQ